jgi:translation initiation factor 2B subunit (eIF-2B alpha/beta/delta family)/8-oxo-dGTP pyrophosphatase MutT (NUDIX family)
MASLQDKKPLSHRTVVSSFIIKYERDKPSVALFRRSDKVHTYQHRLAPISGSVEKPDPSPLAAAWREIQEETTLTPTSLELLRQGKSYSFRDESIGRAWTIYPFAYRLKTPEEGGKGDQGIQTDWEHEGWDWYDPLKVEDTDEFGGVPRLAESLRRVWFEKDLGEAAGQVLADGLEKLKNDHESGARQLAGVALEILRDVISNMDPETPADEWWAKVRFASWHIWKNGRESMGAAIMNVLLATLSEIETDAKSQSTSSPRASALAIIESRISSRSEQSVKVSVALASYLESNYSSKLASHEPISILTMSDSSTISHSIRHLVLKSGLSLDLRVLESRPLYEGVSLAGSFLEDIKKAVANDHARSIPEVKMSLYSDAAAALASMGLDIVIIGADRIASSGAVSNKTGSLPTILSARHVATSTEKTIKVLVLGESEKVAPPGNPEEHVVEDNDPGQITRAWSADYNSARVRHGGKTLAESNDVGDGGEDGIKVAIHNVFFEWCPSELIDVYITELGQWTAKDIAKHSEQLDKEQGRFFGDI